MTLAHPDYLVNPILPAREIHLIAGPTGAGKTRWLLTTLLQWSRGEPVFGCPSHPCPWLYCSSDRTLASFHRTLADLGIPRESIPTLDAWDRRLNLMGMFDAAKTRGARLLVIEMFGAYAGEEGATSRQVAQFLRGVSHICQQEDMTIIGVMEQPKMRPQERYRNPRQRISGPAAWGHHSETIILIEPGDENNPADPARVIYCCPRNSASLVCDADITGGHFVIRSIRA